MYINRRVVVMGLAVAALLIGAMGSASVAMGTGTGPEPTPAAAESAGEGSDVHEKKVVQACVRQVAPNLDTLANSPETPERNTQIVAAKQAIGACVDRATQGAMPPEQREQAEAKKQAEKALIQKCMAQVAPDMAAAPKDVQELTPDQLKQRMTDKVELGVCMGELTPEQAANIAADQERALQCQQQVMAKIGIADWKSASDDQLRQAKQQMAACAEQGATKPAAQDAKP